jgi:hypothetical protein
VSLPAPLDPRRKAFAEALGRFIAEVVWGEISGADSQNTNEGANLAPKTPRPAGPAGRSGAMVEVENENMSHALG